MAKLTLTIVIESPSGERLLHSYHVRMFDASPCLDARKRGLSVKSEIYEILVETQEAREEHSILSIRRNAYGNPSVEFTALYTVEYQLPNLRRSPTVTSSGMSEW